MSCMSLSGTSWADAAKYDAKADDTARLEILMEHPDKLWVARGSEPVMYAGGGDESGNPIWHENPRDAVDDMIKEFAEMDAKIDAVKAKRFVGSEVGR